jgi:hypothetical protein
LMRQGKLRHIAKLIGLIFLIVVAGCGSYAAEYRKQGFDFMQKSFMSIEGKSDVYEVIELKNVKVFIVGDRKNFNWDKASAYGSPVAGYANTKNEIHLFGKRVGDKIVVNQAILGHEFNHLLNFKNPKIANPDRLDELGL